MAKITDVKYLEDDWGYPYLSLKIDGKPALIFEEQKPALLDDGVIFLGPGWKNDTPILVMPPDRTAEPFFVQDGFIRDDDVLDAFREFQRVIASGKYPP